MDRLTKSLKAKARSLGAQVDRKFSPVKIVTTGERIVRQILDQISDGKLHVGDKLPSEKMLTEELGASRPSVRETSIH